jgi:hypothetical protein
MGEAGEDGDGSGRPGRPATADRLISRHADSQKLADAGAGLGWSHGSADG